jgi:hypothetical protein
MSEVLDDPSVKHGHVMQKGVEENDPDESLKSLQAGHQTPTLVVVVTTNSDDNGQEFHSPTKHPQIAPIIIMQKIDAATIETPNAARIDTAAMETPTIAVQGIGAATTGTPNAATAAQGTYNSSDRSFDNPPSGLKDKVASAIHIEVAVDQFGSI